MFYSERLNLLFIASPKTGSTSVEAILQELDPDGERFKITLDDRVIDSSCVRSDSLGHATAAEFRQVLGAGRYASKITFGFVRHPIEKIVSAYFFTRRGKFRDALRIRSPKSRVLLIGKRLISIAVARVLPFPIWAFLYPMKRCSDYFTDDSGRVIVDFLGSTNRLNRDLVEILAEQGVVIHESKVPHVNRSRHDKSDEYMSEGGFLRRTLIRRYAEDLALYELVSNAYADFRERQVILPTRVDVRT